MCLGFALKRFWQTWGTGGALGIRASKYLRFEWRGRVFALPHFVFIPSLRGVAIEEKVPEGRKKHGWAGVKHALTSKWEVREGEGE